MTLQSPHTPPQPGDRIRLHGGEATVDYVAMATGVTSKGVEYRFRVIRVALSTVSGGKQ